MTETERSSPQPGSTSSENQDEQGDHKEAIDALEDMFRDRFTDADEVFMKIMANPLPPPPTVKNWYTRPKRTWDWTRDRDNRGGHRHRDSGRPHYAGSRDHHRDQYQDKRHYQGGHYDRHQRQDNRHHPYNQRGHHGHRGGQNYGHNRGDYRGDNRDNRGGNWNQSRQSYH